MDEGEGHAGEVRPAAVAPDHDVRVLPGQLHLLPGLQTDDGLVVHDVIEHTAQRVVCVVALHGLLNGLTDGDTQRAG